MRKALFILALPLLAATPAPAAALNFDVDKLCAWQAEHNGMDAGECSKLENDAKGALASLEGSADPARKDECAKEAENYSGDSGFASYTVYTECLKNGPGGQ